jgi:hypothetical protein
LELADAEFVLEPHRDESFEVGEVDGEADPSGGKPDRARRSIAEPDHQVAA